jgi:hypothetical protein
MNEPVAYEEISGLGQIWKLSHLGPRIQKCFAVWCRHRYRERMKEDKDGMDPGEYGRLVREANILLYSGAFDWGCPMDLHARGSAIDQALQEAEGQAELMRLLLEPAHGKVSLEVITSICQEQAPTEENPTPDLQHALAAILSYGQVPNPKSQAKQPGNATGTETMRQTLEVASPTPIS